MRRGREQRRGPLLAALAAVVLLLSGCASIPTSGPVRQGRAGPADSGDLQVIAPEPARGASPEEIVRGFLFAVGNADREYATARSYLTSSAGATWRPDAGTVVYSQERPVVDVAADGRAVPSGSAVGPDAQQVQATVQLPVVATIDAHGRYAVADAGTATQAAFTLARTDGGQWRISALDDGVLVSETFIGLAYRAYELYFIDLATTTLVPETRWFPRRDSNATVLARELLAGPSPWLAGAVRTGIPPGTELAPPGAIRLEDGVAHIDLTAPAREADQRERALMLAQLTATLRPVEDVQRVTITVDGAEIDVPAEPAVLDVDPTVGPVPVLVHDGHLARLGPAGELTAVDGLPDLTRLGIRHPGMSYPPGDRRPDPQRYAVLAAERSRLLLLTPGDTTKVPEPALVGADLTAPSFDPYGWVWSTSAAGGDTVTVVAPSGEVVRVSAPWLADRRVVSLRASRDGTRVLVASTDRAGRAFVEVAGVVRLPDGELTPAALSPDGPLLLKAGLVAVNEAVWLGDLEVAVLGRRAADEQPRVHLLRVGGQVGEVLAPVAGATGLAAGNGEGQILVSAPGGQVLEQAGAAWVPRRGADGARDPAFAG